MNYHCIFIFLFACVSCGQSASNRQRESGSTKVSSNQATLKSDSEEKSGVDNGNLDNEESELADISGQSDDQANLNMIDSQTVTDLRGTWESECEEGKNGNSSRMTTMKLTDNGVELVKDLFSDTSCETLIFRNTGKFSLKLKEGFFDDESVKFYGTQIRDEMRAETKDAVEAAKIKKLYGYNNWILKSPKNIAGRKHESAKNPRLRNGTDILLKFKYEFDAIELKSGVVLTKK